MRIIKAVFFAFALSCVALFGSAGAVEITPSDTTPPYNFVKDELVLSAGDIFSFDLWLSDPDPIGVEAISYKSTISVSGPSTLSLDVDKSEAVKDDPGYWIYDNSPDPFAQDLGGIYVFSDGPGGDPEPLDAGDIMARYAFIWDGTIGYYTFALNLETSNSRVTDSSVIRHPLQLNPGQYRDDSSFTLHIVPEPTTLLLLSFGSLILLKKRRP